jgi:hypothetical protein
MTVLPTAISIIMKIYFHRNGIAGSIVADVLGMERKKHLSGSAATDLGPAPGSL